MTDAASARAPALSANMRGAAFMALSMAGFSGNDALIKLVSGELPLFQAVFLRGLAVTALLGAVALIRGDLRHRPGPHDRRILVLRSLGEVFATACFLTALFNMPIANASAILQSLPLAMTLGAALVFGERVGWRRWLAIVAGFAGVLIIVRPGSEGFNAYALLAVAAVAFVTLRDLSTHRLSPEMPSFLAAFATALAVTAVAGLASLAQGWAPIAPRHPAILVGAAVCLMGGYLFGVMAMRSGEIAVVSPFRYTLMIWAILFGWTLYGEVPDVYMLTGAAIIVATGLYTFRRERRSGAHPSSGLAPHS